mmetsp:Transcript_29454/g.80936  ORF Transcript_29454/g.80936 Transcript_29454/m.80936 type:complete len:113 (-) Transcript_29454:994-1332(-)
MPNARRMVSWYRLLSSEGDRDQRPGFGFLRRERLPLLFPQQRWTTYSVYPVTAKHRLRHVHHDGKKYDAIRSVLCLDEELTLDVELRELNWIAPLWIRETSRKRQPSIAIWH